MLLLLLACPKEPDPQVLSMPPAPASVYPETRKEPLVEELHGVQVADPYRWLEDSDAPEVKAWVEAQNKLTFAYLGQIEERDPIRARMTELWDFERYSAPFRAGKTWFWYRNDGLQPQSVLYVGDSPQGPGRVLLDPNTLSPDGTVSLGGFWPNEDGTKAVYSLSDGGSDWNEFRVMDIATGKDEGEALKWIKFSGASWMKDGSGFFYSRYDDPSADMEAANYFQKLYFHKLGTPQSADELIYERKDQKEWGFGGSVTEDGKTLVISNWQGTERKNRLLYKDLTKKNAPVVELLMDFDAQYSVIGNDGNTWYIETDKDAPKGKLMSLDITKPGSWKELIPQGNDTLQGVSLVNEKLVCTWLHDARSRVTVHDKSGKLLREVELPGLGTAGGFGGKREDKVVYYSFTSYLTPGTIYSYDLGTDTSTLFRAPDVSMDPALYETTQVFFPSADGTKIPMFITHKKGLELDGQNPTYLYGYGGFNIPLTPAYSTTNRVWMEMGGVLVVVNLRGGGEYGKEWHDAGRLLEKQNVFDDFAAAARWLIDNKYTSTPKLAIGGRSNGGLLVGASITQHPELFGAALPGVGVMDMLRFHKFTIGWAWTSDYGSPDDPEMFKYLLGYSPYHNVKQGTAYPATLVTTGDHDDRVVPGHSFKFAAALQAAQAGPAPVLIRVETRAGHGAGKPTQMVIEEWADQWAFLVENLKITLPAGFGD